MLHYVHPRELHALGQYASEGGRAEDLLHSVPAAFRHAVQQRQGMQQVGAAVWAHAMGPEGWAGRLLRSRKTIAVVGEGACRTLFVHAGLLPDALALFSASAETDGGQARGSSKTGADLVDRVNAGVVAELARCDGAHTCPAQDADKRVHWLFGSNGVFWTRDYAMQREGQFCGRLQAVLDAVGAKQAVSGHTVQVRLCMRLHACEDAFGIYLARAGAFGASRTSQTHKVKVPVLCRHLATLAPDVASHHICT